MTPEPMSDERLAEIGRCFLQLGFIPDSVGQELLDEVIRLRAAQAIPPDVLAAMDRYRAKPPLLSSDEWWQERRAAGELIANHFTAHHGKDGT